MQLRNKDIICFAGEDWWYHNPHSNLHIMKSFAKTNRILFVNSISIRMPSLRDKFIWKRVLRKLKSLGRYFKKAEKNIYTLTPVALPLFGDYSKLIQKINKWLLIIQLRIVIKWLGFKGPLLWVCAPTAKDVALYLKKKLVTYLIYYCVDNISYYSGADQEEILSCEIEIQRNADLTLFVNHRLVDERKMYNTNTFHIPHGVDYDHFSRCQGGVLLVPDDIRDIIGRPIAGYVGAIGEIDLELVKFLADRNKDISFVFIGGVFTDLSAIKAVKNVYFFGKRPYEILPNYIQAFSCCCIFYKVDNKFNIYRNPKKLNEYLASGKPVVSVDILEANYYSDCIKVAKNYDDFNRYLHQAIFKDSEEKRQKRIEFARDHTWDSISLRVSEHINKFRNFKKTEGNKRKF